MNTEGSDIFNALTEEEDYALNEAIAEALAMPSAQASNNMNIKKRRNQKNLKKNRLHGEDSKIQLNNLNKICQVE